MLRSSPTAVCTLVCGLTLMCGLTHARGDEVPASPADVEFFEKSVRPLLVSLPRVPWRSEAKREPAARLARRGARRRRHRTGGRARQTGRKPARRRGALRRHVSNAPQVAAPASRNRHARRMGPRGAPWGDEAPATETAAQADSFDLAARMQHWSFQPLADAAPPEVSDEAWIRTPVDRFILAGLAAHGLSPAPPADRATLLRRVTFDLTGLPPTPEEITAFLADDSPAAYAKVVDRLLASPRYGERWARHWLDLVRFAETYGHEFDFDIPNAYRYRDYVIRALNADVPYDQFLTEHIAGDLLQRSASPSRGRLQRIDPRHRLVFPGRECPLAGRRTRRRSQSNRQPDRRLCQDVPGAHCRLRRVPRP